MAEPAVKPVVWVASTRKDLRQMPAPVQDIIGFALYEAQRGGKHDRAKPLSGFGGAGVLEIVDDHDGDTYRAVYTVRFARRLYVLHVFQKKSRRGIRTPPTDLRLIQTRLRQAEQEERARTQTEAGTTAMSETTEFTDSSGNIFADLGLPNPEERLLKADLALHIKQLLDTDGLTSEAAATRLRIPPAKLEDLRLGRLADISVNELLEYVKRLGRHIQIHLAA